MKTLFNFNLFGSPCLASDTNQLSYFIKLFAFRLPNLIF